MQRSSLAFRYMQRVMLGLLILGCMMQADGVMALVDEPASTQEAAPAAPRDWLEAWHVKARLKEEIAYRLSQPNQLTKLKTIGWIEGRYDFSPALNLRLSGRGWYDGVFDLTDHYPAVVRRDQQGDLDLRQALLSVSAGALDMRLGRQQIVWGEALGTFITDVVNPKDFREFVLPEFTEIRIPLWALDVTYTLGKDLVVEGVWTPDLRFNRLPGPGAEFQFFRPPLSPNVLLQGEQRPPLTLGHSQGGVRVSYLVSGWDLALLYYDAFDPTPVFWRRQIGTLPNRPPLFTLTPEHPRLHMLGGTVGKSLEPVVIRAEILYTLGKVYNAASQAAANGVVRSDTLDYLLSLDYTVFGKLDTTWQLTQKILTGSAEVSYRGAVQGRVSSALSLRLATGFFENTLNLSVLMAVNVNRGDYRISPRLDYLLTGALTLTVGADVFTGPQQTLYGQFTHRDHLYVEVEYRFAPRHRAR